MRWCRGGLGWSSPYIEGGSVHRIFGPRVSSVYVLAAWDQPSYKHSLCCGIYEYNSLTINLEGDVLMGLLTCEMSHTKPDNHLL
jgi:hypothetical protein